MYCDWGCDGGGSELDGLVKVIGGVAIVVGRGGTGGVADVDGGGGPDALTALDGGPLGGGGAAFATGVASGSFLFTHLFCSES